MSSEAVLRACRRVDNALKGKRLTYELVINEKKGEIKIRPRYVKMALKVKPIKVRT
jgi:hypothetical protein